MTHSQVLITPALSSDFITIAEIEAAAFATDELCLVALGPDQFSDAALASRAADLGRGSKPGETAYHMKAVTSLTDGTEAIVGFVYGSICVGRFGSKEEKKRLGTREAWAEKEKEDEGKEREKDQWRAGGNVKLCEDVFVRGDEHMAQATRGMDYAKLFSLVVSPEYQRRGIGARLLKAFLQEADKIGLQAILGASLDGIGLYKKNGFAEVDVTDFKLWEYEGGEGKGAARHVIMHRPAVTRGSADC